MKKKLYETKKLVRAILEAIEDTRNSDALLYVILCREINPISLFHPFGEVILDLEKYHLPPFETVRRARQKVQEEHPELRPCKEVEAFRAENEVAYQEFATNN